MARADLLLCAPWIGGSLLLEMDWHQVNLAFGNASTAPGKEDTL